MAFTTLPDGTHRYTAVATWTGSTGAGYDAYDRTHRVVSDPATATLQLANDPSLGGRAELLDPEQLLLAAASSCQLLSLLAVAARARVDVRGYRDDAEAVMAHDPRRPRLERIVLRTRITVAPGVRTERVEHLVEVAHRGCYIANSLATPIEVVPEVVVDGG